MGVPVELGDGLAERRRDGFAAGAPQLGTSTEDLDDRHGTAVSL